MKFSAMARVTALMGSVMDLHVRLALQEVSKEKRRVIGGGVFLAIGAGLASMACLALQLALILWIRERYGLSWLHTALVVTALNAVLATMCEPAPMRVAMVRCKAACPLAVVIAPMPPSSAATRCSSTALVGLLMRLYT